MTSIAWKWRQRPIACQFCKSRKIRCSRRFPCSNCTTRGIPCRQQHEPTLQNGRRPAAPDQVLPGRDVLTGLLDGEGQSRVDQLDLLTDELSPNSSAGSSFHHNSTSLSTSPFTVNSLSRDAVRLCQIVTNNKDADMPNGTLFLFSPIQLIEEPFCVVSQPGQRGLQLQLEIPQISLNLPLHHEACTIMQIFKAEISSLHPSLIVAWLPPIVESIYFGLQQHGHVKLGRLLFFVSIVAWTIFCRLPDDEICLLFQNTKEAHSLSFNWAEAGFRLVEEIRKRNHPSLDCLQGQLILLKLSLHLEGLSQRNRGLLASSLLMAREIGLHHLDGPTLEDPTSDEFSAVVESEVGRRIWWDLVSLDWLLAAFPGSQQGVYSVHPLHMTVKPPSDARNSNGTKSKGAADQLPGHTSDLTYLCERLRLAELVREFSDRKSRYRLSSLSEAYRIVLEYDQQLQQFLQTLPDPFTSNQAHGGHVVMSQQPEPPMVALQRVSIQCWVEFQRCMVHIPYFPKSAIEPKYEPSRQACLTCAENTVHLLKELRDNHHSSIVAMLKENALLNRCLSIAGTVFLMDLCLQGEGGFPNKTRPGMADAWELMSEFQDHFNILRRFFHLSAGIMEKYGVIDPGLANNSGGETCFDEQYNALAYFLNSALDINQILQLFPEQIFHN